MRTLVPTLSDEQRAVVQAALARHNVFLTGNAGCGKTVVIRAIVESFQRKYGKNFKQHVAVCAPTGIAATHIEGRTFHSTLGIGVVRRMGDFPKALAKRGVTRLRKLEVLILDEVSMVSAEMFECLSWFLGQVRKCPHEPFGGVQIILCGDMGQLPSVPVSAQTKQAFEDVFLNRGYAFQAPTWRRCRFRTFHLRKIWRQQDVDFATLLQEIKEGREEALDELLRRCGRPLPAHHAILPTELFGTNNEADAVNERAMARLTGPVVEVTAEDDIVAPQLNEAARAKWIENDFFRDCQAPATLRLKEGAQVMLVKNLDTDGGADMLVNGSRGIVRSIGPGGVPVVEFRNGRVEEVRRAEFAQEIADGIFAVRKQVPLRLAWGLTQWKAQGLTLDCARVSLDRIFSPGQVYVALSRVRDMDSLEIVCGSRRPSIKPAPEVIAFYEDMDGYDGTEAWEAWMKEHPIPFL